MVVTLKAERLWRKYDAEEREQSPGDIERQDSMATV